MIFRCIGALHDRSLLSSIAVVAESLCVTKDEDADRYIVKIAESKANIN
jgi:hypothetical protein